MQAAAVGMGAGSAASAAVPLAELTEEAKTNATSTTKDTGARARPMSD